jgi:hypothetical protein
MRSLQQVRVLSGFVLTLGCAGLDSPNYDAPAPARSGGGVAGYSYQAGRAGQGSSAVLPAPRDEETDWGPADADAGAPNGAGGRRGDQDEPSTTDRDPATGGTLSDAGYAGATDGGRDAGEGGLGADGGYGRGGSGGYGGGAGHGGAAAGGSTAGGGTGATSGARGGGGGAGARGGAGNAGNASLGGAAGTSAGGTASTSAGGASDSTTPSVLFSEYVEGSKNYKALELRAFAPSGLDGCRIVTYSNGELSEHHVALSGALAPDATLVVCSPDLAELLGPVCTLSATLTFNGNDALVLECGGATLDVIGQVGVDPGNAWTNGDASTANATLRRRCSVTHGDVTGSDAFDPELEWRAFSRDDFSGLGLPDCG